MKFNIFKSQAAQVPVADMNVILTSTGMMVSRGYADGQFTSGRVTVPEGWCESGTSWMLGRPIDLATAQTQSGNAGEYDLWMATTSAGVTPAGDSDGPIRVFTGSKAEADRLALVVRQLWLQTNQSGIGNLNPTGAVYPAAQASHVAAAIQPAVSPGKYTTAHQKASRMPWAKLAVGVGLCVGLVGGGWAFTSYYLKSKGPAIDLSSMSVDDVANLDANPAAVKSVQEGLIAAMGVGQAEAQKMAGKVEQDHIDAMKAMGLDPGISMKNAMGCLADKK